MRRSGFIVAALLAIGLIFTSSTSTLSASDASGGVIERFERSVETLYGHWVDIQLATLEHLESGESLNSPESQMEDLAEKYEALRLQVQNDAAALVDRFDNAELVRYLRSAAPLPFTAMLHQLLFQYPVEGEIPIFRLSVEEAAELISAQPVLEQKILEMWWDDRLIVELLSGANREPQSIQLRDVPGKAYLESLGAFYTPMVKRLVSPERLQAHLAEATRIDQVKRLPKHIDDLIEAGVLHIFADLSEEWLLEQVEAGKLLWLNSLANAAPELAEPFLIEHSASMDLTQRLRLVTTQPRPDDLLLAQDAWRRLMDAAWCEGCGPTLDPDLPEALVAALMSMSGEEPARMLSDLLAEQALPDFDLYKHNIGIQALMSDEPALQRVVLDLAERFTDIPLMPYNFPALHANAPERIGNLAEQRLKTLHSPNEPEQLLQALMRQGCEAVGLAFYLDPVGDRYDWRGMLRSVAESEQTWAGSGCSIWLGKMVSIDNHAVDRLELITQLDLDERLGVDEWTGLMRTLRPAITELQRLNLTAALLDTPIWGELDESWREWLLREDVGSEKASSYEIESSKDS